MTMTVSPLLIPSCTGYERDSEHQELFDAGNFDGIEVGDQLLGFKTDRGLNSRAETSL